MMAFMAKKMEVLGIGPGQYAFLFALYNEDGQTQQGLSDLLPVDKSATARAIGKLEQLGYVIKKPDSGDRRSYRVFLAPRGREIRPALEDIVKDVQETLLEGLCDKEKILLKSLLRKMSHNMIQAVRSPEHCKNGQKLKEICPAPEKW